MLAIGIDPGTIRTGFGVVQKKGRRLIRIGSGVIRTTNKAPMEQRLLEIHEQLDQVLTMYGPEVAAVEDIFFSKNAASALKLGQARGAIIVTLARRSIPIVSYPPTLVKRSVVGTGRADKGQVSMIVKTVLGMEQIPQEDEGDALAIAICRLNAPRSPKR